MNKHLFEGNLSGKLLLLTAKIVMPLVVAALLVVTPTFVPRRLLLGSYLLDLVLRLSSALVLLRAFWLLPDLVQRYDPRGSGWSTRLWQNAARRASEFLVVYIAYTGAITLVVTAVSAWAFSAFLPSTGAARWLLPVLFGAQFAALYALQYAPMRQKVTGLAPARGPAVPPANGSVRSNGRVNGANGRAVSGSPRQDMLRRTPRSIRGVVITRRRPTDED